MSRQVTLLQVLAVMCALFAVNGPARACTVCVTLPEHSLADRLMMAQFVVLAAPTKDNPFRYVPVEVLKGNSKDLAVLPEIPFLVDSATRAAVRADPDRSVLMMYGPNSRDRAGRALMHGWTKGFLMTPARNDFVALVLAQGPGWNTGGATSAERVAFFAGFLQDDDRLLRNTALIELHRAPYDIVRGHRDSASTRQLLHDLRNLNRIAYAPPSIRMLGLQSDDAALAAVRSVYPGALQTGGLNLRDWALAAIEVDGAVALVAIAQSLRSPVAASEDARALVRALVDAGNALPAHRAAIVAIFAEVLETDTGNAARIAVAVRDWGDESLVPRLRKLLFDPETDPATAFALRATLPAGQ